MVDFMGASVSAILRSMDIFKAPGAKIEMARKPCQAFPCDREHFWPMTAVALFKFENLSCE
jgi:hypothetical protein